MFEGFVPLGKHKHSPANAALHRFFDKLPMFDRFNFSTCLFGDTDRNSEGNAAYHAVADHADGGDGPAAG